MCIRRAIDRLRNGIAAHTGSSSVYRLCSNCPVYSNWCVLRVFVALRRYAGAGLFDSVQSTEPMQTVTDYSTDMMCNDLNHQCSMLAAIGVVSVQLERLLGSAQDIEGVIDHRDAIHIVQTRPQV